MDVVEVGVGEGHRPDPVDGDAGFAQRLRQPAHGGMPGIRRPGVDQCDIGAVVEREGVDRQPQLAADKAQRGRGVVQHLVAGPAQSRYRHVDMAVAQRGDGQRADRIGCMELSGVTAFHGPPRYRWRPDAP